MAKKTQQVQTERILEMFDQGATIRKIGRTVGHHWTTVRRVLDEHGRKKVKTAPAKPAWDRQAMDLKILDAEQRDRAWAILRSREDLTQELGMSRAQALLLLQEKGLPEVGEVAGRSSSTAALCAEAGPATWRELRRAAA